MHAYKMDLIKDIQVRINITTKNNHNDETIMGRTVQFHCPLSRVELRFLEPFHCFSGLF